MKKFLTEDNTSRELKDALNYIEFSPILNCTVTDSEGNEKEMSLKIYADKRMRKSFLNRIVQGELDYSRSELYTLFYTNSHVLLKTGARGEDNEPIKIKSVKIYNKEIADFNDSKREVKRTAKEQADYLFGRLIAQAGGVEWIKEQTWIARGQDIIHNNNKGNVAYTRLDIMLNRCLKIYTQFKDSDAKTMSGNA